MVLLLLPLSLFLSIANPEISELESVLLLFIAIGPSILTVGLLVIFMK